MTQRRQLPEKTSPERLSSTPLERPVSATLNQHLCHHTSRNRPLDSLVISKESTEPDWTCTPVGDLKGKISRNWSQWQWKEIAFPRLPGQALLFLTLVFSPVFLLKTQYSSPHFSVWYKRKKPLWMLDLSPGTPVCLWCQRSLGLICCYFLFSPQCHCWFTCKPLEVT